MNGFTSLQKGNLGLAEAIAFCARQGYTVCIPLTDTQKYDLVAEIEGELIRIQAKATNIQLKSGGWNVELRRTSIRKTSPTKISLFDPTKVDFLFVLTGDGQKFFIPTSKIAAKNAIVVGNEYSQFKVS